MSTCRHYTSVSPHAAKRLSLLTAQPLSPTDEGSRHGANSPAGERPPPDPVPDPPPPPTHSP